MVSGNMRPSPNLLFARKSAGQQNLRKSYTGGVAERPKAAVLKTVGAKAPVGSNPTPSANAFWLFLKTNGLPIVFS